MSAVAVLPVASVAVRARSITELVTSALSISGSAHPDELVRLFEQNPEVDAVAVLSGSRPRSITRGRFFLQLGKKFGYALFEKRPVEMLAEEASQVDASADSVEVIQLALQRAPDRIYDDIMVVEAGRFEGFVSMRSLLAHHKELLLASLEEVSSLDEENRRLAEINRVQNEFVANMTHELRTPIHTILGIARLLAAEAGLGADARKRVALLTSRGQELLGLINNVLEMSKIEAGAIVPLIEDVELRPFLKEVLGMAEPLLGGRPIRLRLLLRGAPVCLSTDPVLLQRILTNLLSNALKFTEAGLVTLGVDGTADPLRLWVEDTGIGIREADLPRLFTKFTQLEATKTKRHGGTGLGLSIVKSLTAALGGTIAVTSREDAGTTFTLSLPQPPTMLRR